MWLRRGLLVFLVLIISVTLRNNIQKTINLWKVHVNDVDKKIVMELIKIKNIDFINAKTGIKEKIKIDKKYSLFVFSSGVECSGCLANRDMYDQIALNHETEDLKVYMIAVNTSLQEGIQVYKEWQPPFLMYIDINDNVEKYIGLPSVTPVQVLIDIEGNVMDTLIGTENAEKYETRIIKAIKYRENVLRYLWHK